MCLDHVEAIDNVDFLAPFKFYKNERRTLSLQTRIHPRNDAVVADCALIGRRTLANQVEPIVTTHFTGSVRLTKECAQVQRATKVISPHGSLIEARDIYRVYFHGPAYQVLERAWWDGIRMMGKRLQLWRLANFKLERLPSVEDVYLFHAAKVRFCFIQLSLLLGDFSKLVKRSGNPRMHFAINLFLDAKRLLQQPGSFVTLLLRY